MTSNAPTTSATPPGSLPWKLPAGLYVGGFATLLVLCFAFPAFWYTHVAADQPSLWLNEITNAPGWRFTPLPIDKSAEARLAADAVFCGEYTRKGDAAVRLFTAKRFKENPNEIGLFVHTPDRCWTESGWRLEPVDPDFVELDLGGSRVGIERRVFAHPSGNRELVYFFGLVGGQSLPYRLDHNLGVGQRFRRSELVDRSGAGLRAVDRVLWRRVWDSFASRRPLLGPKEFIRISTPATEGNLAAADERLRTALAELLQDHAVVARASRTGA